MTKEKIEKELEEYNKQKDILFADYLRVDGIIAYLQNELKKVQDSQKPLPSATEQSKTEKVKSKQVYGN